MVDLKEIQAAQGRIAGYVRRVPLVEANPLKQPISDGSTLYLKLESLQISGSFKTRGAVNKLFSLPPNQEWGAGIPDIRFVSRFIYLAVILDACSRAGRGWASHANGVQPPG